MPWLGKKAEMGILSEDSLRKVRKTSNTELRKREHEECGEVFKHFGSISERTAASQVERVLKVELRITPEHYGWGPQGKQQE